jgi:hypothetical protein
MSVPLPVIAGNMGKIFAIIGQDMDERPATSYCMGKIFAMVGQDMDDGPATSYCREHGENICNNWTGHG